MYCPFCKTEGAITIYLDFGIWYYAMCDVCEASGPAKKSEQDAIDAWNEVALLVKTAREKFNAKIAKANIICDTF